MSYKSKCLKIKTSLKGCLLSWKERRLKWLGREIRYRFLRRNWKVLKVIINSSKKRWISLTNNFKSNNNKWCIKTNSKSSIRIYNHNSYSLTTKWISKMLIRIILIQTRTLYNLQNSSKDPTKWWRPNLCIKTTTILPLTQILMKSDHPIWETIL